MTPEQKYRAGVEAAARDFRARRDQIRQQAESATAANIAEFNQREASVYAASGMKGGNRAKAAEGTGMGDVRLGFLFGSGIAR